MPELSIRTPIKVAIADDHARFRGGLKAILSTKNDINFTAEAENGQQLLDLISKGIPDVILLDIQMPVMDGITTLPIIRKMYPNIKVIILSMHNDHSMINHLMARGAHAYLPKNTEGQIIYETIQSCFTQEAYTA